LDEGVDADHLHLDFHNTLEALIGLGDLEQETSGFSTLTTPALERMSYVAKLALHLVTSKPHWAPAVCWPK